MKGPLSLTAAAAETKKRVITDIEKMIDHESDEYRRRDLEIIKYHVEYNMISSILWADRSNLSTEKFIKLTGLPF